MNCVHALRTGRHKRQADITLLFQYIKSKEFRFLTSGINRGLSLLADAKSTKSRQLLQIRATN